MKLNEDLLKILSKVYEKSVLINSSYKGNDIAFKTDAQGNPVLLFIGRLAPMVLLKVNVTPEH